MPPTVCYALNISADRIDSCSCINTLNAYRIEVAEHLIAVAVNPALLKAALEAIKTRLKLINARIKALLEFEHSPGASRTDPNETQSSDDSADVHDSVTGTSFASPVDNDQVFSDRRLDRRISNPLRYSAQCTASISRPSSSWVTDSPDLAEESATVRNGMFESSAEDIPKPKRLISDQLPEQLQCSKSVISGVDCKTMAPGELNTTVAKSHKAPLLNASTLDLLRNLECQKKLILPADVPGSSYREFGQFFRPLQVASIGQSAGRIQNKTSTGFSSSVSSEARKLLDPGVLEHFTLLLGHLSPFSTDDKFKPEFLRNGRSFLHRRLSANPRDSRSCSNTHWKFNFYLGMLDWTRRVMALLLHLEPAFNSAHSTKVWGAGCNLETSVKICAFDWQQVPSTNWTSRESSRVRAPLIVPKHECLHKVNLPNVISLLLFLASTWFDLLRAFILLVIYAAADFRRTVYVAWINFLNLRWCNSDAALTHLLDFNSSMKIPENVTRIWGAVRS